LRTQHQFPTYSQVQHFRVALNLKDDRGQPSLARCFARCPDCHFQIAWVYEYDICRLKAELMQAVRTYDTSIHTGGRVDNPEKFVTLFMIARKKCA